MSTKQPEALALTAGWTDSPVTLLNSGNAGALGSGSGGAVSGYASVTNAMNTNVGYVPSTTTTLHVGLNGYGWPWGNYWYPYYVPIYHTEERRPIKLTMAEIEGLRVAAKKDKTLKATLEKFTDHIEVIVDFGNAP